MDFRFTAEEKLKSRKVIAQLFSKGKSMSSYPVKLFFVPLKDADSERVATSEVNQIAFAVPKRNFKLAVTRNRIKRQMREAYRLHKQMLSTEEGKKYAILILYIGKEIPQYQSLEKALVALFEKLVK